MTDDTDEIALLSDGSAPRMGLVHPTELRFAAVPTWAEANPTLPESEWEEHDDFAPFCEPPKAQNFNNCTNASMAWLLQAAFKSEGMDCPDLSMSYQYALSNGGRDQGASCRDIAAGVLRGGLPPASVWPESQIYIPRGGVSQAVKDAAAKYQALEIYQCMTWEDVCSALTRRFKVYHGFVLGNAFINRTGSDGIVPEWDRASKWGQYINGHAQGSRGLRKINGVWRTITPNTWGSSWGDKGIGYIPQSYFLAQSGNFVNLDAYAIRAIKPSGEQPPPATESEPPVAHA